MKGICIFVAFLVTCVFATEDLNQCPEDYSVEKLLPHKNCSKYYQCVYGSPVERSCPQGLKFNAKALLCDWADNVNCDNGPEEETIEEISESESESSSESKPDSSNESSSGSKPEPNLKCSDDWSVETLLPHEQCNKFYKCAYGVPVELSCQEGLLYNPEKWQCDWPENVDCSEKD